jgi:hypothetical protein
VNAKPNDAARAKMRLLAADLRTIVEVNNEIGRLYQQAADALERGDLAAAVGHDRQVVAEVTGLEDRHDVVLSMWDAIEAADPVAWADAAPRDEGDEGDDDDDDDDDDDEAEGPANLFDMFSRAVAGGLTPMRIDRLSIEECRYLIAEHGKDCRNPSCPVIPLARARITKLGGIP